MHERECKCAQANRFRPYRHFKWLIADTLDTGGTQVIQRFKIATAHIQMSKRRSQRDNDEHHPRHQQRLVLWMMSTPKIIGKFNSIILTRDDQSKLIYFIKNMFKQWKAKCKVHFDALCRHMEKKNTLHRKRRGWREEKSLFKAKR